eukprot:11217943-Lingulodinium_polyedra.AAC.1
MSARAPRCARSGVGPALARCGARCVLQRRCERRPRAKRVRGPCAGWRARARAPGPPGVACGSSSRRPVGR